MKRAVNYRNSFDRLYRKLEPRNQIKAEIAIDRFLTALESEGIPHGVGLKRLRGDHWEIRVDLSLRICFRMSAALIEFGAVGDHGTIEKFLKNI